jgi:hypothetical protein
VTAKLLFWLQVVMALVYTIPQIHSIVTGNVEGLNLAIYAIMLAYIIITIQLSLSSFRLNPDIIRKHTLSIMIQWGVYIGLIFILGLKYIVWTSGDTIVFIVVVVFSAFTVIYFKGIKNPYSKGFIAVWCKAVPQLWLAFTIYAARGGDGLPLFTLVAAHATSIPRLMQVWLSGKKCGWDHPTRGLILGETANVATWTIVTIVWVYFKIIKT